MAGFGSQKLPVAFTRLGSGPGGKQKPAHKDMMSEQMGDGVEITDLDHLTKGREGLVGLSTDGSRKGLLRQRRTEEV